MLSNMKNTSDFIFKLGLLVGKILIENPPSSETKP